MNAVIGESSHRRRLALLAGLLAALLLGACQSQQQLVSEKEDRLAAAGFVVKLANTPQRQAMLARLPPHKFVIRQNGNAVHYVYADPLVCACLYVGTQQAYNQYRANQLQQHLADEQQLNAQMYSDAAWQWEAWGPWGPPVYPPGFGFVYGPVGW